MGTLIELANCTLDILSHLVSRPLGQALGPPGSSLTITSPALDVRQAIVTTQRTLECVLFYATTQLGAWLARPELFEDKHGAGIAASAENADADMETDLADSHGSSVGPGGSVAGGGPGDSKKGRRRESLTLAERLRRGMTGEMANELKGLMEKARPVLQKSRDVVGGSGKEKAAPLGKGKGKEVELDIVKVLVDFLGDRIVGRT